MFDFITVEKIEKISHVNLIVFCNEFFIYSICLVIKASKMVCFFSSVFNFRSKYTWLLVCSLIMCGVI